MSHLFAPLQIRDVTFRNRVAVSPMCQYSSEDGFANDWHLVHLGSRAAGGAAAIITEAAAVEARGRISPADLGIWKDEHVEALARIARFVKGQGAVAGTQIAHAGRKASTRRPWEGGGTIGVEQGGWQPVAPSPVPFRPSDQPPAELSTAEIGCVVNAFAAAARRALAAGFELLEIHCAHGYLAHEFLSPLSNRRTDEYGGSFENRIRFALELTTTVRNAWPERLPLFVRISATDWMPDGWTPDESVELARRLHALGVDLIDCSSGGTDAAAHVPVAPGYQVPFAERIRKEVGVMTGAVGLITTAQQAEEILAKAQADLVLLAREMLRDPYFAVRSATQMGEKASVPVQYSRAW